MARIVGILSERNPPPVLGWSEENEKRNNREEGQHTVREPCNFPGSLLLNSLTHHPRRNPRVKKHVCFAFASCICMYVRAKTAIAALASPKTSSKKSLCTGKYCNISGCTSGKCNLYSFGDRKNYNIFRDTSCLNEEFEDLSLSTRCTIPYNEKTEGIGGNN